MNDWIEVTYHEITEEEREFYSNDIAFVYDCRLPADGQDVLITTDHGYVQFTTFYNDDCAYFEGWEDRDDVKAWMPLPGPFKKAREQE